MKNSDIKLYSMICLILFVLVQLELELCKDDVRGNLRICELIQFWTKEDDVNEAQFPSGDTGLAQSTYSGTSTIEEGDTGVYASPSPPPSE